MAKVPCELCKTPVPEFNCAVDSISSPLCATCYRIVAKWPSQRADEPPVVRCACFIAGGIQCNLPMYHDGQHVYEPVTAFSKYVAA